VRRFRGDYKKRRVLTSIKFHCRADWIVIRHMVDPSAHWIAPHRLSIAGFQQFGCRSHIFHAGIKSQVGNALEWKIGGSKLSTDAGTTGVGASSLEGMASGASRVTRSTGAKAREALWTAMCFNMSVAD
jgi:hypothetical protein